MSHPRENRLVPATAAVACVVWLLAFSCDRVRYPFEPFTRSTATLCGVVRDSLSNAPLRNATVRAERHSASVMTDSTGKFRISSLPTGKTEVTVSVAGYCTRILAADITLDPETLYCALARTAAPPRIERLEIDSAAFLFRADPVTIRFCATDSSGGIAAVLLFTNDTSNALRRQPLHAVHSFIDSFTVRNGGTGILAARLCIFGAAGDSTDTSFTLGGIRPARPSITLIRTGEIRANEPGFISGEPGSIQVMINDPDAQVRRLSVDWGDGQPPAATTAPGGSNTFWHTFTLPGTSTDARSTITVALYGSDTLLTDTSVVIVIERINPPMLASRLFFSPSQYCAPSDTSILIGVRVLDIEGYIGQMIWIINENDAPPVSAFHLEDMGEIRGAVPDSGALFVHRFPTASFKGANSVEIRVLDRYGNMSSVSGSFYIAGKPGG